MSEFEFERICRHMGWKLGRSRRAVFAFLEQRGLRFLVDFGFRNCYDVAARLAKGAPQ